MGATTDDSPDTENTVETPPACRVIHCAPIHNAPAASTNHNNTQTTPDALNVYTMTLVSNQQGLRDVPPKWSALRRLMVSLPIFLVLIGILNMVSRMTTVPWTDEPKNQVLTTSGTDTSVTFANPTDEALPQRGTYTVVKRYSSITLRQQSTGAEQSIRMLERYPVGAQGSRPAFLFMHGAGYGTADDSFGDVAQELASAGFVTMVIDKPVWNTNSLTRDYMASADAYEQVMDYLRELPNVDPDKVGLYATSESTWISAHLLQDDHKVAFQILLSPMVFTPRQSLGFFVAQDVAMVGAHLGYESIVRRVFSVDFDRFGLHNADFDPSSSREYAIPTFVAYGSKDVMTAQVQGVRRILDQAHQEGNSDVTVRSYPDANHVLRLGDASLGETPLEEHYVTDMVNWAVGQAAGLQQSSERITGVTIRQSIAVPLDLKARPTLTWYMVLLHSITALAQLASGVAWAVTLVSVIHHKIHHLGPALGYQHGFGWVLLTLAGTSLFTILLFIAGLVQLIISVMRLDWGADPVPAGVIYWSWPFIQVVCTAVVWAWSRVIVRMLEVASVRGMTWKKPLHICRMLMRRSKDVTSTQREPVLATTRLGRTLFVLTGVAMLFMLLVFAFWGLFIY